MYDGPGPSGTIVSRGKDMHRFIRIPAALMCIAGFGSLALAQNIPHVPPYPRFENTIGYKVDPNWPKEKPPPNTFVFEYSIWWRPGGVFSKPLLANPQFRKLFLARTKELLETVYTEKVFFPLIDKKGQRASFTYEYSVTY